MFSGEDMVVEDQEGWRRRRLLRFLFYEREEHGAQSRTSCKRCAVAFASSIAPMWRGEWEYACSRPRHELHFFFFSAPTPHYQVVITVTPSRPPAQDTCEQIPPSRPLPSLRSFPIVFVFLFQAMTTSPVDVCAEVITLSVFLALATIGIPRHTFP
jgi:hypothetical protein